VRFGRIRSDHYQLFFVDRSRNANRENFDPGIFRQPRFYLRLFRKDVSDRVGDKKYQLTNAGSSSTIFN